MTDEEDVEDEEVVLPTCANISVNSCLEHDTYAKILLFFSNQIYFKESKQCGYIFYYADRICLTCLVTLKFYIIFIFTQKFSYS